MPFNEDLPEDAIAVRRMHAAADGVPPGTGALVAGGASVVVCANTPFATTPRIIHATMPDTSSKFTITRCRKIVFMSISFCSFA